MSRDGRRRVLSYEERVLWTAVTKAYTPLREPSSPVSDESGDVKELDVETPPPPKPRKAPPVFVKPAKIAKPAVASPPPKPTPAAKVSPDVSPLSRRMRRNVARGKEGIDARLDLHGMTQAQSHATLLRFLRAAVGRDARLVLIITGKGRRTDHEGERERGVLRRQVPQWLGQPEFRDFVIGFEDAAIAHGGEGALYVRLRKVRSA